MRNVKITPKNKQAYIDAGFINEDTDIGTVIEAEDEDFISSKSFKTFNVWMIIHSKAFKERCLVDPTKEQIDKMKLVGEYIKYNLNISKYRTATTMRLLGNFVQYDLEGCYLERFKKIQEIPSNQRTDSLECLILSYGEQEGTRRFNEKCNRVSGKNNPAYNHGGRFSPFSTNFVGYDDLTEEEKQQKTQELTTKATQSMNKNGNNSKTIEYYMKRGMTEEEAKRTLSKSQCTFSLEKCIEKYGEEKGRERWLQRQEVWQTTINSKTQEEILEINKKKMWKNGISSKIENELFEKLKVSIESVSSQLCLIREDVPSAYYYDIFVKNKIIEFNGDFWHMNPSKYNENDMAINNKTAKEIWESDNQKIKFAEKNGYDVMVVWEQDYRNNKDKVIEECINFLTM